MRSVLYQAPHFSRALDVSGISIARLSLLPENVKRELWLAFAPDFGVVLGQADEDAIKKLQEEIERERQERKDVTRRLGDLEELVRRLVPSTEEQKERSCA